MIKRIFSISLYIKVAKYLTNSIALGYTSAAACESTIEKHVRIFESGVHEFIILVRCKSSQLNLLGNSFTIHFNYDLLARLYDTNEYKLHISIP